MEKIREISLTTSSYFISYVKRNVLDYNTGQANTYLCIEDELSVDTGLKLAAFVREVRALSSSCPSSPFRGELDVSVLLGEFSGFRDDN